MDEILTFIIIWVVLYLINLVTKKLKKQQTGQRPAAPPVPVSQVQPPSVLDTRGQETMSQSFPEQQLDDSENNEEYFEEQEELVEQEVITEAVKKPSERFVQPAPVEESYTELKREVSASPPRQQLTLKQYIIWKEILDKPLSMRNHHQFSKNRVS